MTSRSDPLTAIALTVTVVSVAATAPLTAAATASPLAMAFWRNALGFATLGVLLLVLRRREVARIAGGQRRLVRREQGRPMLYGLLAATSLALHFAAFMTSTRLTTVAMSTALVATQPVWQALLAAALGERAARRTWFGLTVAVLGAVAAAGLDLRAGGTALLGDALAVAGAIAQAGYTALSAHARTSLSTPLFSTVTSLVCGIELLAVCWLFGIPLTGFDQATQLSLLGLLILPQLLGLGSLNFVLGRASPTRVSVLLLLETPVAALAAWWLLDQRIEPATVPGLALIIAGVTIVITSGGQERAAAAPASAPAASGARPHRDPRIAWSHGEGDHPTVTLAYHGGGAFDTLTLRRLPADADEPAGGGPPPPRPVTPRAATRGRHARPTTPVWRLRRTRQRG